LEKQGSDLKFLVGQEASGPIAEISCLLKMFRKEGRKEGMKEAGNEGLTDLKFLARVGGFYIPDTITPLTRAKLLNLCFLVVVHWYPQSTLAASSVIIV
jgi:hypothetical protein